MAQVVDLKIKRILFLSFFYPPDLCAGSFRSAALIRALRANAPSERVHIDVITTKPNRYQSFTETAKDIECEDGVRVRRIPLPRQRAGVLGRAYAFLCYAQAVVRLVRGNDYDLVFATSSRMMTAVLGVFIAACKRARVYLDIRDIFVETVEGVYHSPLWRLGISLLDLLERWALRRADKINLVSPGFLPYFQRRYPRCSFSFFSNGVDAPFMEFDNAAASMEKQARGLLRVLYAGNIGEGQGLDRILPELARALSGRAIFQVIGDGGRLDALKSELTKKGVDNVEIVPPVPRKELISFYERADVLFLHLNDLAAFRRVLPSKLFEYAATGKPIWAGVAGYAEDLIRSEIANAVVFSPCNLQAALQSFDRLNLCEVDRGGFVEKFARRRIMDEMAKDILELTDFF